VSAPVIWVDLAPKSALDALLAQGTLKTMILDDAYVYDAAHQFISAVSAHEISGTGYTAGGIVPTGVTTDVDGAGIPYYTADPVDGIDLSGCYLADYVDTGTAATSPILTITDLSNGAAVDQAITGWTNDADGIGAIDPSA
jgi:hypothetical protein